ncbi:MAG: cellobiose phosphorylase [Clostridia bacterium]|nr:cellobiose phosphorylase [Clostridia bacterium]
MKETNKTWSFIDDKGTFKWDDPEYIKELYFPLCNETGMMSSITPILHGDAKTGQHHFLLAPVSVEDLHNSKSARNFWFYIHGKGAWSASGNSAKQNYLRTEKECSFERTVEAGLLWHKLTYKDKEMGLKSETLSFVPVNQDKAEIMKITLTNESAEEIRITPTSSIPLYGRSAENIRDHRHVTSLVNRLEKLQYGMSLKPVILFDERGHKFNSTVYYVLGSEDTGKLPVGSIPSTHSFIGNSGDYEWPEAVVKNLDTKLFEDENLDGKEYVGALRFNDCILKPGEKKEYILVMGVCTDKDSIEEIFNRYNTSEKVTEAYKECIRYWEEKVGRITFESGLDGFSNWMRWINLQPILRKIYGCSFLPYHDYGKGGRGWRDLWQDCLSLIVLNPEDVRGLLLNNFGGVRVDGTNATIIGTKPGEFIADRNNISRVWMDHGSWPYLTTKLYVDQSGDMNLLLEKQVYFRDAQLRRATQKDAAWTPEKGQNLKTADGSIYQGTIIEHMIVQHLTSFFNVGEHNMILLEGADWNDTLDMARQRGESAAFTAFYGSNLISLSELLLQMKETLKVDSLDLFEEIGTLLDAGEGTQNYNSIEYKKSRLNAYFDSVSETISGKSNSVKIEVLAADLRKKGEWIFQFMREKEWIETKHGDGYFNGYYNNDGKRVDGEFDGKVRMNLTAQVFTTMFGLATEEQARKTYDACRKYLKDPKTGGYRLNTDLGDNQLNFGRGFAFAYGEKENGATFCHMVTMYMNALYKRGMVEEAYEVFKSLFNLSMDAERSKIYPGVPEYFAADGKGMYHYLTGTASWLLLTVLNEMYGVRGENGALVLQPKLMPEQFDSCGMAKVNTTFAGNKIAVEYINPNKTGYQAYRIESVKLNGKDISAVVADSKTVRISSEKLKDFMTSGINVIQVNIH